MLAFGLAGRCAGSRNSLVNDLGVALSLNSFALGDFLAADGADRITGAAGLGAGGILLVDHLGERMIVLPLGVKNGVLGQINSRTIRIGVTGAVGCGVPAREIVAFTGEGVCSQRRVRLFGHGLRRHHILICTASFAQECFVHKFTQPIGCQCRAASDNTTLGILPSIYESLLPHKAEQLYLCFRVGQA